MPGNCHETFTVAVNSQGIGEVLHNSAHDIQTEFIHQAIICSTSLFSFLGWMRMIQTKGLCFESTREFASFDHFCQILRRCCKKLDLFVTRRSSV